MVKNFVERRAPFINRKALTAAALLAGASFAPAYAEQGEHGADSRGSRVSESCAKWRVAGQVAMLAGLLAALKSIGISENDLRRTGMDDFEAQIRKHGRTPPTL